MADDVTAARKSKAALWGVVAIVGLVVLVAVIGVSAYRAYFGPQTDVAPGLAADIEVPKGASTDEIAKILAAAGVVENANRFKLDVREAGADGKLRAGSYALKTGMPSEMVIDALLAGPATAYTDVTIPEGWRITQIARRLEEQAGIPSDEFKQLAQDGAGEFAADHPYLEGAYGNSLEGFLFPKTYRIKEGSTARDVIEMMLDQFDKEIAAVDVAGAENDGLSLPELVTAASIVERETKLPKERPLVSSVIRNRLDTGMRLQMCSTVVYVLDKAELRLTTAETKTKSPYNTYLHKGLPPGPIASPGLASLKAAASPADTDYIYYVLTGKNGSHTFASNNAEFLRAKAKSKAVFGE
jgi:UPF0755 protein